MKKTKNYLDRIEDIATSPRGLEHLKDRYTRHNVIDLSEENLEKMALALYEFEKQRAISENHKDDIPQLSQEVLDKYEEEVIQKEKE